MRRRKKAEPGVGPDEVRKPPFIISVRLDRSRVEDFDEYPFSLPIVRALTEFELHPSVTFFVGENGSGKSTLMEAIATAWGFNAEGGSRNFNFNSRPSHSELNDYITLVKTGIRPKDGFFLRAESFFNLATEIERLDKGGGGPPVIHSYGGTSLHEQSHGESFLALFLNRFGGNGLYILDEPESALSPKGIMMLIARLHQLVQTGSQFLIGTHSPFLITYPDATILELDGDKLVTTHYSKTNSFQMAKYFANNPDKVMRELLKP